MKTTRTMRLERILERINAIHCQRRILGRRTDHLVDRCRRVSDAYLTARHSDLSQPTPWP